jgi:KUP system potassium uptake protein
MAAIPSKNTTSWLGIVGVLGVVYGDIGTSVLYAFRECFHSNHLPVQQDTVYGILSLVFWALIFIVTLKYLFFILRADNNGEGGTFSLLALLKQGLKAEAKMTLFLVLFGIFGACLLYADALITPAISILSAVEGLNEVNPALQHWIVPIAVVIIFTLYYFQKLGTSKLGACFGPVMLVWFIVLGALGLYNILKHPQVYEALNPWHGVRFLMTHGITSFGVLGSLFLVMTGAEALYADMGHFNKALIRRGWAYVVLPGLVLNYFGQGALLMSNPGMMESANNNVFYLMCPSWALTPLLVVATAATVIASQAVITGAYSLAAQAIQLGYSPRLTIKQTSDAIGQIYMPLINWFLMVGCLALVLIFQESGKLANAYGLAVSGAMLVTGVLFFTLSYVVWKWSLWFVIPVGLVFFLVDLTFVTSNATKFMHGGALPLGIGVGIFLIVYTWFRGRHLLMRLLRYNLIESDQFIRDIIRNPPARVAGTAVFLTTNSGTVPRSLLHNYKHNKVIHKTNVFLTVQTQPVPYVKENRTEVHELGGEFYQIILRYGFRERPNIPWDLQKLESGNLNFSTMTTSYFLSRQSLIAATAGKSLMPLWQRMLFSFMFRNALDPAKYFQIPANRVVELGEQLTI